MHAFFHNWSCFVHASGMSMSWIATEPLDINVQGQEESVLSAITVAADLT